MTSFAEIQPGQIRTDCRFYSGYRPCHLHDGCPGCPEYVPRGRQGLVYTRRPDDLDWLSSEAVRLRAEGIEWIVALAPFSSPPSPEALAGRGIDEWRPADSRGAFAVDGRPFERVVRRDGNAPAGDLPDLVAGWLDRSAPLPRPSGDGAQRILIIKLGAMGDALRTKAILPGIRRGFPEARISWLTESAALPIVDDPLLDEVLPWEEPSLLYLLSRRWDRVYCLDKDAHAVAFSRRVEARKRFGFAPTEYNTAIVWNPQAAHALRLGLSDDLKFFTNDKSAQQIVTEACALPWNGERYRLTIPPSVRGRVRARWASLRGGLPGGTRLIGLNTGCGPVFATKSWTREHMASFVRLVGRREDLALLLLGGPRERELHDFLLSEAGDLAGRKVFDSGTDNSLPDFFAWVSLCDGVATSDSLALHVAIALQVPVAAWFGSTCHQEVDCHGLGEKLVSDFPCSPCYLKKCPKPVFCMSKIEPEEVLRALLRAMEPEILS